MATNGASVVPSGSAPPEEPLITGLHHVNLTIPHGTLPLAKSFYATTLGLSPRAVPAHQADELAWFDVGPPAAGQQIHISLPKHATDDVRTDASRHPCFRVGSPAALLELQRRVHAHWERGGPDAPMQADPPGESSGEKAPEYPQRFFARDYAGNRLEFTV